MSCPKKKNCIHTRCSLHQNTEKMCYEPVHSPCDWFYKTIERIEKLEKINNLSNK